MIFENDAEVDLVNKLLGVIGDKVPDETVMTNEEYTRVQDVLRKSSAAYINRRDRDVQGGFL